jgi:hypothetical protein
MNKAVEAGHLFFQNLTQAGMSPAERLVADLKIQRAALVRNANEYARALNRLERYREDCRAKLEAKHHSDDRLHGRRYRDKVERQAAAHTRGMNKLNAEFPLGFARDQLREINVRIAAAVTDFQRSWLDDRKPGEHFSTSKINSGGI